MAMTETTQGRKTGHALKRHILNLVISVLPSNLAVVNTRNDLYYTYTAYEGSPYIRVWLDYTGKIRTQIDRTFYLRQTDIK